MDNKNDISKNENSNNKVETDLNRLIKNKASLLKHSKWPDYPSSRTGGVIPINLDAKFSNERHRLSQFFDDKWRNWRQEYLESLKLHKFEPSQEAILNLRNETSNIFLKIWRYPFDIIENKIFTRFMSPEIAYKQRKKLNRYFIGYLLISFLVYKINYKSNNWETNQGTFVFFSKPPVYPGDHRYPLKNQRPFKEQFYDNGFSDRKVYLEGRNW